MEIKVAGWRVGVYKVVKGGWTVADRLTHRLEVWKREVWFWAYKQR